MPKFRKKPVIIEAKRLIEPETPQKLAAWCGGSVEGVGAVGEKVWINIPTLEGVMRADYGDWIIRGVAGEFYPCKDGIFTETYEPVED